MFQEEDVTIDMILEMDHEDMKEIGVKTNEPVLVDETPDNFSITNILAANLSYERMYTFVYYTSPVHYNWQVISTPLKHSITLARTLSSCTEHYQTIVHTSNDSAHFQTIVHTSNDSAHFQTQ